MHGVGAADRFGRHLGEAEEAHLARLHLLGHRADGVLDGHLAVAAVLVPEVDVVGLEALQAAVERAAHVLGTAVDACDAALERDLEAELGGDQRAVAAAVERFGEQRLVGVRAVDLGGVEEIDAEVERTMDGRDALGLVGRTVDPGHAHEAGHRHGAEADGRDFEALAAELAPLHGQTPPRKSCLPSSTPAWRNSAYTVVRWKKKFGSVQRWM